VDRRGLVRSALAALALLTAACAHDYARLTPGEVALLQPVPEHEIPVEAELPEAEWPPMLALGPGRSVRGGGTFAPGAGGGDNPDTQFSAYTIGTCFTPCTVHFDGIGMGALSTPTAHVSEETTDPTFERPFHSLLGQWDFADNTADSCGGADATWTVNDHPKATALGMMAGHTFCNDGTYSVAFKVTNPAGLSATINHDVEVVTQDSVFSTAETWCIRSAATGTFLGCPLDTNADGTCDGADADHCITQGNAATAITSVSDTAGCNAGRQSDSSPPAGETGRCLFRRGDTFTGANTLKLADGTGPGLIGAFGSGDRPILAAAFELEESDDWHFHDLDIRQGHALNTFQNEASDGMQVYNTDVTLTGSGQVCLLADNVGAANYATGVAWVENNCTAPAGGTAQYLFAPEIDYFVFQGGVVNRNDTTGSPDPYSMRSNHQQHWVLQHTDWIHPEAEFWKFRADDDSAIFDDPRTENRFLLLSWNRHLYDAMGGNTMMEWCVDSGCNCGNGIAWDGLPFDGSNCGDSGTGRIVDVHDTVLENNRFLYAAGGSAMPNRWIMIMGHDHTIRNNFWDLQSVLTNTSNPMVEAKGAPDADPGSSTVGSSSIHVYGNTFYSPVSGFAGNWRSTVSGTSFGTSGCTGDCLDFGNHFHVGSFSGGGQAGTTTGFTQPAPGNVVSSGADLWDGTYPAAQAMACTDIVPIAGSTPTTTGYPFDVGTDFDKWLHIDLCGNCRPVGGVFDSGAVERGASACP
jgi:hypothetical protein